MNLKRTNFSTIIIVDKNQETKTLQVKTSHLKRVKHYAFSIVCIIVTLSASVIYLNSQNAKQLQEKELLLVQLKKLKEQAPPAIVYVPKENAAAPANTASTANTYIQSIQVKLKKINDYLSKRGLKGFSVKAVGGNTEQPKLSANEQYSLYDEYLSRLVRTIAAVPMGYPKLSSMTSVFGYRGDPFNSEHAEYHPGIDFKGAKGDAVKCTANGKVVHASWYGGYGNCIIIKHMGDFETLYGHLSHINVKVGQEVKVGEVIGEVGSTGHSTGAHLHYEVRKSGKPVNPVKFLTLNNN
ncbi:MAG: peptidoglycan DD-metalloendopeptidase family protein [Mucilaginibacter sp.]|jgi:murein DD-endopeptidase MepM/ murein hydrolase activator NlpD|nr:peptidoglycan DD-metalloendopeptidase family protein [Mucilaginibacter sp.]